MQTVRPAGGRNSCLARGSQANYTLGYSWQFFNRHIHRAHAAYYHR